MFIERLAKQNALEKSVNSLRNTVIGSRPWIECLDSALANDLTAHANYRGSVSDLLRALRNISQHFNEMSVPALVSICESENALATARQDSARKDELLASFISRKFPLLFAKLFQLTLE